MRAVLFTPRLIAVWMTLLTARAQVVVTALPEPQGVFNDFPNVNLYPIDLNNDALPDFTFAASAGSVSLRTERANRVVIRESPPPNIGGPVAKLDAGFLIGRDPDAPGLAWINSASDGYVSPGEMTFDTIVQCLSTGCLSTWPPGPSQRGFIGLEFELSDGLHYAYFDVSVSGSNPGASLYGWAYESLPSTAGPTSRGRVCPLRRARSRWWLRWLPRRSRAPAICG